MRIAGDGEIAGRRFDACMIYGIYSERRGCIVDDPGTHRRLSVNIELSVAGNGGLKLRLGAQRSYEKRIAFAFPLRISGIADVSE